MYVDSGMCFCDGSYVVLSNPFDLRLLSLAGWMSIMGAIMAFGYSFIAFGLSVAKGA